MKKFLIVEPTTVTLPHICKAIAMLGYDPLIVCDTKNYSEASKTYLHATCTVNANTAAFDDVVATLCQFDQQQYAGVITTADRFIPIACRLAEHFGIPGPDRCLLAMNSKCELVEAAPSLTPRSIVFDPKSIPTDALQRKLKEDGAFICKPGRAAGGDGLLMVSSEADIESMASRLDARFVG